MFPGSLEHDDPRVSQGRREAVSVHAVQTYACMMIK